tara:strand:- start:351 stop:560 length:210 start_codon:yes stop_codon:yes gene_type:complete
MISNAGNSANGSRAVTGIGIGSVIHQMTTQIVTARVMAAFGSTVVWDSSTPTRRPAVGPKVKARVLRLS